MNTFETYSSSDVLDKSLADFQDEAQKLKDEVKNQRKDPETMSDKEIKEALEKSEKVNFSVYTGFIAGTSFQANDKFQSTNFTNLRVGGSASIPVTKWMKSNTEGAWDNNAGKSTNRKVVGLNIAPNDKLQFNVGKIPTPTGLQHRQPFLSGSGQFETRTQSKMSGIRHGTSAKYTPSGKPKGDNISAGVFRQNSNTELHLAGQYRGVKASVWKNQAHKNPGVALTVDHKGVHTDFIFDQDVLGNSTFVSINKKKKLTGVIDVGYNPVNKQFTYTKLGLSKGFDGKNFQGKAIVLFDPLNNTINVYLLLHNTFKTKEK